MHALHFFPQKLLQANFLGGKPSMLFTPAWWVCVEKSLECMPPQPAASLSLYIQDLGQSFSLHQSIPPNQYIHVTYRPTTIDTLVYRYIAIFLTQYEYRILNKLS